MPFTDLLEDFITGEGKLSGNIDVEGYTIYDPDTGYITIGDPAQGIRLYTSVNNVLLLTNETGGAAGLQIGSDTFLSSGSLTNVDTYKSSADMVFETPSASERLRITSTDLVIAEYTQHTDIPANSAILGPTAPTLEVNGSAAGLGFDAAAETAYFMIEIPSSWNGTSNMALKIYWTNESGDALANTETVKWDIEYRSILWGTETTTNNAAATGTVTYTQSGAGVDGDTHEGEITLDYQDADQPISAGDNLCIVLNRDTATDTYSGKGVVTKLELSKTINSLLSDHM